MIKFLHNNRWFLIFAILYSLVNLIEAARIDFESSVFLPFRYEGLLFFENAVSSDTNAFFFIRDWSTSFLPEEHPLLYFHNLDLVHFFAGFIQYFSAHGKVILFVLSLLISLYGLWIIVKDSCKYDDRLFTVLFVALLIIPVSGFRVSPQNLFIALAIFCVVWNLIILRRIRQSEALGLKFFIELFCMSLLVAMVETNLAVLLVMITGFIALFTIEYPFKFSSIKKIFLIAATAALPIVLLRLVQLVPIYFYGYMNEYMMDISYTSKLKVNSDISTLEAIAFYARNGLTFFGQGEPQQIGTNIIGLTHYYRNFFGQYVWSLTLIFSLVILIGEPVLKKLWDRFVGDEGSLQFQNITFMSSYILFFTASSYLLLFLSGDAIIKVFLQQFGIIDIAIVYRAFFILLLPFILYTLAKKLNLKSATWKWVLTRLAMVMLVLLAYFCKDLMLETRKEYFDYKRIVSLIPEGSTIISNFEPSILSVETKSRVNIAWYDEQPYSCSNLNSKKLLKMYKVNNDEYNNRGLYIFLVRYPHYYGSDKDALLEKHCVNPETHRLLYEDELNFLYKYDVLETSLSSTGENAIN